MTTEEAIKILDPDTTTEALAEYEYFAGFRGVEVRMAVREEACRVVCDALRAQHAPVKLDRSRWELSGNWQCVGSGYWMDDADSYCCPCCGYETNNPNKEPLGPGRCPRCLTQMKMDNDPLTLEELREMEGEPVWLQSGELKRYDVFCGFSTFGVAQFYKAALPSEQYGKTWLCYRRNPEEE